MPIRNTPDSDHVPHGDHTPEAGNMPEADNRAFDIANIDEFRRRIQRLLNRSECRSRPGLRLYEPGQTSLDGLIDEVPIPHGRSAITQLPHSGWKADFLHGPDMMMPMGHLLQRVSERADSAVAIPYMEWRMPAFNQLQMTVTDAPPEEPITWKTALNGAVTTVNGQTWYIRGAISNEALLPVRAEVNPCMYAMACACESCVASVQPSPLMPLTYHVQPCTAELSAVLQQCHLGMHVSTVMDLVAGALQRLIHAGTDHDIRDGYSMIARFNDVTVPSVAALIRPGLSLSIAKEGSASPLTRKGFRMITYRFVFSDSQAVVGSGTCTLAQPDSTLSYSDYIDAAVYEQYRMR